MNPEQYAVELAKKMLTKELSFFEGAVRIAPLRFDIAGVDQYDDDFIAFVGISSETDHLPLEAQRTLWNPTVLKELEPEFVRIEEWASTFAVEACENIIKRFDCNKMVSELDNTYGSSH